MNRNIERAAVAVVGAAAACLAVVVPAQAAPVDVVSHPLADTASEGKLATGYWTAERMREAVELDQILLDTPQSGEVSRGAPSSVAATPADDVAEGNAGVLADSTGAPWEGDGAVVQTEGWVFFSFDGQDASCSGNAVTSANGSTVMTAGHCVKYQGSWHTNWVFVPGYHDGQAPHGEWPATETLTTPQWEASEDINYDVGAAVVQEVGGQRLTDAVGGQGIAFNQARGQYMHAFGHPAADPYDGEKLIYCAGTSFDDPLLSTDHGLNCDMTGGSSGGPWFVEFDEAAGTGRQASVNSFGYVFLPGVMFGPYFGDEAQALYETAQGS
ncbi:MAG: trypsin-like serine peptidase [Thermocrispum sp.]